MSYVQQYIKEASEILKRVDQLVIERMVELLVELRERRGRLFFLGVGGGAGPAPPAVNDFRKIAGIESYTPTHNVSELTGRTKDAGSGTALVNWPKVSRLSAADKMFF